MKSKRTVLLLLGHTRISTCVSPVLQGPLISASGCLATCALAHLRLQQGFPPQPTICLSLSAVSISGKSCVKIREMKYYLSQIKEVLVNLHCSFLLFKLHEFLFKVLFKSKCVKSSKHFHLRLQSWESKVYELVIKGMMGLMQCNINWKSS